MAEEFEPSAYGQYVTEAGKTRWRRLPPGVLERRIRDVCVDWLKGNLPEYEAPFTVAKIRKALVAKHDGRPVSDYGIDQALKRWGKIGAAELGERPFHFIAFTQAASEKGFKKLREEYNAFQNPPDPEADYEPFAGGADQYEWSDVEAYAPVDE